MNKSSLLCITLVVVLVCVYQVYGTRSIQTHVRTHWTKTDRVPGSWPISITVALKQRNVDLLERSLRRTSNPRHPDYGKHLTVNQIADMIAPPRQDIKVVMEYFQNLHDQAYVELSASRDFIGVQIPAQALEKALGIRFHHYRHVASNRLLVRTEDEWSLPASVAQHIQILTGLSDFVVYPKERKQLREQRAQQIRMQAHTESGDNAPDILIVNGNSAYVAPTMALYCQDGTPATESNLCNISGVEISTKQGPVIGGLDSFTLDQMKCSGRDQLRCTVQIPIRPWHRCNISVQTAYSPMGLSNVGYYGVLHSPTSYGVPQTVTERYGIPPNFYGSNPKNSQSVGSFEDQWFSHTDLKHSFESFGLAQPTPEVHGENVDAIPGGEAQLDITYIMGVAPGIKSIFWSVSGPGPAKPPGQGAYILEWAYEIGNSTDPPLVSSLSYGDTEDGFFNAFGSYSYIDRMEVELMKMGSRGLTVVSGSGDAGASNVGEAGNDISPTDPTCTPLRAFYPSCSSYCLGVSATFLSQNIYPVCSELLQKETPIECDHMGEIPVGLSQGTFWTTGGGFSKHLARNEYQKSVVDEYLAIASDLPPNQYWNSSGQAYADTAAMGYNLLMFLNGELIPIGGTSASSPITAAVIALLNDARLNAGKSSLGFINPALYDAAAHHIGAFNDVVTGTNKDGDLEARGSPFPSFCPYGFTAGPGWDPVTGLGSPNFEALREYVLSLP